jgi:hypothetical protein
VAISDNDMHCRGYRGCSRWVATLSDMLTFLPSDCSAQCQAIKLLSDQADASCDYSIVGRALATAGITSHVRIMIVSGFYSNATGALDWAQPIEDLHPDI